MNTTTIQKWGNSYAVRLPREMIRKLNLQASCSVEIREATNGKAISIIPTRRHNTSLKEMIACITNENKHSIADWGNSVGEEVW